ncbi:MAG: hypothetical protein ACLQBA_01620 [Candidatus Binataceae bacterium]
MIPVKHLFDEVIASLRNVIAPAIAEPYQKAQAYMAAVILEFIARQVDERVDLAEGKQRALEALFARLPSIGAVKSVSGIGAASEAHLCELIERLYADRTSLGEEVFTTANRLVRETLRQLLDQDLKVAGPAQE